MSEPERTMLSRVWRTIRNRIAPTAVILRYHRVADLDQDPLDLAVSLVRFDAHMRWLGANAEPLALAELVGRAQRGALPARAVAVTFDDGYADNLLNAAPVLQRTRVPATFFLATGAILRGEEFWWDQVEAAFLRPVDVPAELDLPIGAARWRWYASTDRREAFLRLLVEMRKADPADRRAAITRLRLWSSTTPATRETHRPLTASEVAVLASIGGMAIGAHTVEHALLASQHEACLRREVEASRDHVTELAGVRPTAFAYPFGGRRQFDHRAARLVRSAGFAFACSTRSDRVWRGSGRWKLPRIAVRNWDVDEFARRLAHDAGWA